MARIFKLFLFSLLFLACTRGKQLAISTAVPDSSLSVTHAKGFRVDYFPQYKKVSMINPWKKDALYACYYLVNSKHTTTPPDGQKIVTPLHTLAASSCTHFEFLQLIGELDNITGVCSSKFIYNTHLLGKIAQGKVIDLGDPFSLNIERVALLHPDAVMVSGFNQEDPVSKRLIENGTPVIFNNEWMETSLLARAEWIKFVAAFYNKEQLADSLYTQMETNYQATKNKLNNIANKPTVMCGGNFKGTWYMPGGRSYMAGLLADAGADYYYANDSSSGSLPLNFEVALSNFRQAKVWIGSSANSIEELLKTDERHGLFAAAKNGQVYNFNRRRSAAGGNDFWESGVAHPDVILADMIKVFHPELMTEHALVYVKKLEVRGEKVRSEYIMNDKR